MIFFPNDIHLSGQTARFILVNIKQMRFFDTQYPHLCLILRRPTFI